MRAEKLSRKGLDARRNYARSGVRRRWLSNVTLSGSRVLWLRTLRRFLTRLCASKTRSICDEGSQHLNEGEPAQKVEWPPPADAASRRSRLSVTSVHRFVLSFHCAWRRWPASVFSSPCPCLQPLVRLSSLSRLRPTPATALTPSYEMWSSQQVMCGKRQTHPRSCIGGLGTDTVIVRERHKRPKKLVSCRLSQITCNFWDT